LWAGQKPKFSGLRLCEPREITRLAILSSHKTLNSTKLALPQNELNSLLKSQYHFTDTIFVLYYSYMEYRAAFIKNLNLLIRPVVRIALRHGVTADDITTTVKQAMVEVCANEYGIRGRPTSKSRIAAMTNISRAEVAQLLDSTDDNHGGESNHPLSILIGIWLRDAQWHDASGNPAVLDINTPNSGFQKLARQASSAVPFQTLLRELTRLEIAEQEGDKVKLVKHGFIPGANEKNLLRFLGEDAAALIDTISFNMLQIDSSTAIRRFQRKASFHDLTDEGMELLNELAQDKGQSFLEKTDQSISAYRSPDSAKQNRLRGIGIYVFDLKTAQDNQS
jgi:hypothetical protein